jgi:hypothetical protein
MLDLKGFIELVAVEQLNWLFFQIYLEFMDLWGKDQNSRLYTG